MVFNPLCSFKCVQFSVVENWTHLTVAEQALLRKPIDCRCIVDPTIGLDFNEISIPRILCIKYIKYGWREGVSYRYQKWNSCSLTVTILYGTYPSIVGYIDFVWALATLNSPDLSLFSMNHVGTLIHSSQTRCHAHMQNQLVYISIFWNPNVCYLWNPTQCTYNKSLWVRLQHKTDNWYLKSNMTYHQTNSGNTRPGRVL